MSNILIAWVTYTIVLHLEMNSSLHEELEADINQLIILGSLLHSNEVSTTLRSRLEKGALLLHENPQLRVIVTGGNGTDLKLPEAHIMKNVLIEEFGISEDRIIVEDLARNTFENLLFCKPLIKEERVAIVTSEFHSIRTGLLAHRLHLNCQLIGAKTDSRKRYKWELREQLALVKSLFLDREKR